MSSPEQMRALIERVEAATGPDREIDAAIFPLVEGDYFNAPPWRYLGRGQWNDDSEPYGENVIVCPRYTGSIDAAASLVPSGWVWLRKTPQTMTVYMPPQDEKAWAVHIDGAAPTPALALTAAALRARLAEMEARDEWKVTMNEVKKENN